MHNQVTRKTVNDLFTIPDNYPQLNIFFQLQADKMNKTTSHVDQTKIRTGIQLPLFHNS